MHAHQENLVKISTNHQEQILEYVLIRFCFGSASSDMVVGLCFDLVGTVLNKSNKNYSVDALGRIFGTYLSSTEGLDVALRWLMNDVRADAVSAQRCILRQARSTVI